MRLNLAAPSTTHLWILVAISAFAWSFGPICIRYAFQYDIPPELISSGRMITGALFFTPYGWVKNRLEIRQMPSKSRWLSLAAGALFGVNITLMAASLQHVSVIINQALIATIPIWVAVFEVTLLKAQLNRAIWIGVLVAMGGGMMIALATTGEPAAVSGGNPPLGILMAVVSACSASLYIIAGRKVRSSVSFIPYIWLVYTSGAFVTLLIIALGRVTIVGYDPRGYLWVLLTAILAQIIGHGALNYVLKYMSPTTLTMTVQSVPVLSAAWAFLVFSEIPTLAQAIGSMVLIAGVTIVLRGQNGTRMRPD